MAWGPEYGLRLACASSDENVSVLTHHGEGQWSAVMLESKDGKNAPTRRAQMPFHGLRARQVCG